MRKIPPEYLIVPNSGHRHRHVVMLVKSVDEFDRPVNLVLVPDNDSKINVEHNQRLITAYLPECNIEKTEKVSDKFKTLCPKCNRAAECARGTKDSTRFFLNCMECGYSEIFTKVIEPEKE